MYKLISVGIHRISDGAFIPNNPNNRDWRKYQTWLAEGNEPLPMDIVDPWIELRQKRNLILQSCDWTLATDSPISIIDKGRWEVYRQELRDLPSIYPDAGDIVWPTSPEL